MKILKKTNRQVISLVVALVMIVTICISNTTVTSAAGAVVTTLDSINVNLDISDFEEGKALPSWGASNADVVGFGPRQEEVELFVQDLVLYIKGTQAHVDKGYINQSDLNEANNGWVEAGMYSEEYRIDAGDKYQAYYWFGIEDGYSLDENAADKVNVLPSTVQLERVETGKTDYGAWVTYYADMYFTFSVSGEAETPEERPNFDFYDPIIKEHGVYVIQTVTRTEVSEDTEGAECWVEEDGTEKYYLCEYNYKFNNGKELVKKEFYKDKNTGHFYFEILMDENGELYGIVANEGGDDITVQKLVALEQQWFDQYWLQEYGSFPDEIYPDDWENECNATINNVEEVISNVPLTDAEKEAVDNGKVVDVSLTFDDMGVTADTDAKKEILDKKGEYTVGTFLDINLIKIIGGNQTYVAETNGNVKITFELPETLKNTDKTVDRIYNIMRNHDGEVEMLDATYNEKTEEISFETDKFSTYAVVYKDIVDTDSEDGNKPDDTPSGEKKDIERIFGKSRYTTSLAIADELKAKLNLSRFKTVIIANGENFPDALAGSYLAAKKDAPILMVNPNNTAGAKSTNATVQAYIEKNLVNKGKIYILGGTAAVPQYMEDNLKDKGYDVKRVKGKNRYETNIEILNEAGVTNEAVLVCTGENFADSLSASASGLPIFLVDPKTSKLTESQRDFLNDKKREIYIIGGSGAVSDKYLSALEEYDSNGKVERVKGASRYETSIEVAKKFIKDAGKAVVASAQKFPDGLCGGPLAYAMDAPLVLTHPSLIENNVRPAREYITSMNISIGKVLGGVGAVEDGVVRNVFNMKVSDQITGARYD